MMTPSHKRPLTIAPSDLSDPVVGTILSAMYKLNASTNTEASAKARRTNAGQKKAVERLGVLHAAHPQLANPLSPEEKKHRDPRDNSLYWREICINTECPLHKSRIYEFKVDEERGEKTCNECGVVQNARPLESYEEERRNFEDGPDHTRTSRGRGSCEVFSRVDPRFAAGRLQVLQRM